MPIFAWTGQFSRKQNILPKLTEEEIKKKPN